ncbi:MAG: hypothetical protein H7101_02515, partial [Deinococcales bacterium]|nr:hypothetical protein [Chitinophagaceae bacterium]
MLQRFLFAIILLFTTITTIAQADYFYPTASNFNPAIPTPEAFLGYAIGTHHTRHDKLVEYFKELDRVS